ncbi:MAG: NAD(P)-dependent alcohol dehydrogenase [Sphingobium sp.]
MTVVTAAVVEEAGGPMVLRDLRLDDPRADELRVRMVACGICQTDAHVRDQHIPMPLPAVLGHEGAGIVEAVGSAVTEFSPGDHVVMSYRSCGACRPCRQGAVYYCDDILPLNFGGRRADGSNSLSETGDAGREVSGQFFGQSSFATQIIANQQNAVKVDPSVPLDLLAPLGCGIQTGFGAVLNALKVAPGSRIAIFGCGAVGLAAIMASAIAGAATIIAIDRNRDRLALALDIGATHGIHADSEDVCRRIGNICGAVDYSVEAVGHPDLVRCAVDVLAPLGVAGLVGTMPPGATAPVEVMKLLLGRTVRGIHQGDAVSKLLIPKMVDFYKAGRLPLERLVRFYPFEAINTAFSDAARGEVVKPVLRFELKGEVA